MPPIVPPTPPTDSLYKFAALFGLVLMISSAWLIQEHQREAWERSFELARATADAEVAAANLPNPDTARIGTRARVKAARSSALKAEADSGVLRRVAIEEASTRIENLESASWVAWMLLLIGAVVSFGGFVMWYRQHQRYLDMILRRQAQDASQMAHGGELKR